ncbi:MAG: hypothetical protein FWB96_01645 [Defluviitaleaceae bacterium]|nr:hypothetical protein [Defluviitaleaceae bacterium]MCL2261603.1 hypothetical protein [Defluviitaleaceae bacterium]
MDSKKVRTFIRREFVAESGQTLGPQLRHRRNKYIRFYVMFMAMLGFPAFYENSPIHSSAWMVVFIAAATASVIIAVIAIVIVRRRVQNYVSCENATVPIKQSVRAIALGSVGTTAGLAIGIGIIRSETFSQNAVAIFGASVIIPTMLLFVYVGCAVHYCIYLMKKHCPELL